MPKPKHFADTPAANLPDELQDLAAEMVANEFGISKDQFVKMLKHFEEVSVALEMRIQPAIREAMGSWLADTKRAYYSDKGVDLDVPEEVPDKSEEHPAILRVRAHLDEIADSDSPMINARQVLGLLSPTWPDGNYEEPRTSD